MDLADVHDVCEEHLILTISLQDLVAQDIDHFLLVPSPGLRYVHVPL